MSETVSDQSGQAVSKDASQIQFNWQWQDTLIAGNVIPLAVAADPDGMLIDACERQDAGEEGVIDPFWAATWRAASGLDRFLDRYQLSGLRVLELGCGTGHAGLSAAVRGAKVLLTDGVDDPLGLVRLSAQRNAIDCSIKRLRFGIDQAEQTNYPIILGSDVTYLRTLWPELDQCLKEHLANDGEVLLSDPFRIIANEFKDWIQQRNWHYEEHSIKLDDDLDHPIRIMRLRTLKS